MKTVVVPFKIIFLFSIILWTQACVLPQKASHNNYISDVEQDTIKAYREGNEYFIKGRYLMAEMRYLKALDYYPREKNIRVNLVNSLIKTQQFKRAQANIDVLQNWFSEDIDILLLQAKLYLAQEKYRDVIALYEQGLALAAEYDLKDLEKQIYTNLSSLYFQIGKEQEALCAAIKLLEIESKPENYARVARQLIAQGYAEIPEYLQMSVEHLSRADQEYLEALIYLAYLTEDYKLLRDLITRLEILIDEGELKTELSYLRNLDLLRDTTGLKVYRLKKDLKSQREKLYQEDEPNAYLRIYWPARLLKSIMTDEEL